jgi:hypothetical protein
MHFTASSLQAPKEKESKYVTGIAALTANEAFFNFDQSIKGIDYIGCR